ncbi:hypothetical protein DEJ34_06735 [Curtobacterium sp. MCPF17_050]|uniref:hypothetical protein n=1 Tax=Curtobacterium sp. MCPF17_050 TaxID=2175664 RepID=UPI000D82BC96|nr:hypothetical protein [Curtobacterium sp. MCPF17_050]WIB16816.1 hypothetical protein DEJ34_06735 [Curtobacterium sp. MCPF17_050]
MPRRPRRSATTVAVLALGLAVTALTGCSSADDITDRAVAEEPTSSASTGASGPSGSAPIVFAFTCAVGDGPETETYTTAAAVWEDGRTSCTAAPITGTEPSEQQRSALAATEGDATLEQLAAACAVSGTAPWTGAVTSRSQAHLAAGLERYCPGHPEIDRLRDALDTYRG